MPDAVWITIASVAVLSAVCSITLGTWLTARAWWGDRRAAKRGGYLDLTPTPDRERLGAPTRKPRRGSHRPGL